MKRLTLPLILLSLLTLPFCTTTKQAMGGKEKQSAEATYTYVHDIAPIIQQRCTPCHFPDGGKRQFLDTHTAVVTHMDEILYRVQLPMDSTAFMPFKSKKEPLSDSLIQVLITWKNQGMVKG